MPFTTADIGIELLMDVTNTWAEVPSRPQCLLVNWRVQRR
jgi:hypothetical protein